MTLDPHARRFLDMIAMGGVAEPDVAGRRASLRSLARLAARGAEPAETRDLILPGPGGPLHARLYVPAGAEAAPSAGLLFFHGGGFVAGDLDTHDGICRALTAASGCRTVSVAYRLAPEHPFPAAVEDARASLAWVAAHAPALGIDPARLAVGGDSAGAGLAARLAQEAREHGPAIAAQILLCPVLDGVGEGASRADYASGYFLDAATIARDVEALGLAGLDLADPRLSPLRAASLAGLPPAIIHTAEYDIVRDDGTAYAARIAEAGVPVRHTCHRGMIHFFYGLGGLVPAGRPALAAIGRDLAEVVG
ncbi:alpha/beta hydrolase [Methylobacterium segetis]|uniref:alpha/beta hydrolase n=1 Tax=Methylobacterium segetis TaxID=2488750 RepID=UPI001050B985|nr:alpha/beta hydrolase [Methylobacterium segetis]